jgi:microcystin-dependent protein
MAKGIASWSQTAANNATADATVNFAEGQAPSTVNDSARALMASAAMYRDDTAGAIATGGTSTAFTVSSYQGFGTLAAMHQQVIAFTPNATNTGTTTLNVDSLGAKPLRSSPGVEIVSGCLVQGTPYVALYNNSDGAFYLHGFYASTTYNVPILAGMDYWDTVAPNSNFIFPAGQAISRTTYAYAFSKWGTTYGAGDGSTTFNVPDKTERVSVMKASSASRLTSTYFGGNSTVMGATGGSENTTLTLAQLPTGITSAGTVTVSTSGGEFFPTTSETNWGGPVSGVGGGANSVPIANAALNNRSSLSGSNTLTSNNTSGNAHRTVQPTIVCNYIIRVL